MRFGDWDWESELGIRIGDWKWGFGSEILDWGLELGIRIWDLGDSGFVIWDSVRGLGIRFRDRGFGF